MDMDLCIKVCVNMTCIIHEYNGPYGLEMAASGQYQNSITIVSLYYPVR